MGGGRLGAVERHHDHERSRGTGKRAPTVRATPPLFLETNQFGSCTLVNPGTVPREVALTCHTEETRPDGTPRRTA